MTSAKPLKIMSLRATSYLISNQSFTKPTLVCACVFSSLRCLVIIADSLKMQMELADVQRKTKGHEAAAKLSLSRKRVQLTAVQVTELELSYQQHCRSGNRVSSVARRKLAGRLGLQLGQVNTWFKNRRARARVKSTLTGVAAESESTVENSGIRGKEEKRLTTSNKRAMMKKESNFLRSCVNTQHADLPSIRLRLRLRPAESKFSLVSDAPVGAEAGGTVIPAPAMPVFFTQQFEPVFKQILADAPNL